MLDAQNFREIVSGRRRGFRAALWRSAFAAAELPYRYAVGWRNRRYDLGRAEVHRVDVPVLSVGNLTVGGTGKTPMVEWLASWFRQHHIRVAIVSRGYGAEAGARNDEALELEQKLPDVPHLQNPDRVAAARIAIEELETQLILLDDAYQHRRIHRDLNLVLIDALEPFGYGHLLPRGLLREPLVGLRRADVIALTRADAVPASRRAEIRDRALRNAPSALWIEVAHQPAGLLASDGRREELDRLRGEPVAAFCGIGNPDGFRHTLDACGFRVVEFREFPDHHAYDRRDIGALEAWAAEAEIRAVVCTHKDLVKIALPRLGKRPLWAVLAGIRLLHGGEEFEARLAAMLERVR